MKSTSRQRGLWKARSKYIHQAKFGPKSKIAVYLTDKVLSPFSCNGYRGFKKQIPWFLGGFAERNPAKKTRPKVLQVLRKGAGSAVLQARRLVREKSCRPLF
jgi:hypothetical protein